MGLFYRKVVFLLLIFCGTTTFLFSQHNNLRFDYLTLADGLSQSSVNCLLQDKQGFIWLGTQDGLNRYDGYSFSVFKNESSDSTSISDNYIHALAQDNFGNIWAGTDAGLNRLNLSNHQFERVQTKDVNISSTSVNSIFVDKKNQLWVATSTEGLFLFQLNASNAVLKRIYQNQKASKRSLPNSTINVVFVDSKSRVWIGTEKGALMLENSEAEFVFFNEKSTGQNIKAIVEDDFGNIWLGGNNGLNKIDKNYKTTHFSKIENDNFSITSNVISCGYKGKDGTLWFGTENNGLLEFNNKTNRFSHYESLANLKNGLSSNKVFSILQDNSSTIWVGTELGANKFDRVKENFTHFLNIPGDRNSISSNTIWSVFKDNNFLWVGCDEGLNIIDRENQIVTHFTPPKNNSTPVKNVFCIYKTDKNEFWLGTENGIYTFQNNKISKLFIDAKGFNEINNKIIYDIFQDKAGNFWIGTKEGLIVIDKKKTTCAYYVAIKNNETTITNSVVRSIVQTPNGTIWLATNGGGLNKVVFNASLPSDINRLTFSGYKFDARNLNSINNNTILSLWADKNGIVWIGTYGGGLNKFDPATQKFAHYTEKNGLSNNTIYGIVEDKNGKLWMSTNNGVACFDKQKIVFQNYYENDGLQSNEFNTGAYHVSNDGEVFFGGINGFNAFYPNNIKKNEVPPQIVLTDFQIFNKSVEPGPKSVLKQSLQATKDITLSYKNNFFSFSFAGLHYSSPEKNQYKFMMEGLDEDWNYVGNRRHAFYTNLEPGNYVFKVTAANADGVWNENPLSINITITPPFWKTWWFRILVIVAVVGGVIGYSRWKIKAIEKQNRELEQLVQMRTETIEQKNTEIHKHLEELGNEKEKVERLLLNILPSETVEELKTKGKAKARQYKLASVMFTDFKGFTKISETLSPKELVEELDRYFIKFDEIIEKYGLEKIKTIGDAYMCAGGLPIRNKSNPVDIILAGLEIQQYMKRIDEEKRAAGIEPWQLRIGVNTGELIAGVVGIKRFAYDIWGDTVNIANRMESSGEVGKVNISGITYELVKEFFVCTHRGKVEAKNKGEVDMYFVESLVPELSVDGLGIKPNKQFYIHLDYILYSNIQYKKAEHHIVKLLKEKLSPELYYHGLHHTLDVCRAAEEIAVAEGVTGEDLFVLKTAALFHDAGFIEQYHANEPIGMKMARDILPQYGFSDVHIDMIDKLIMSTQIPQSPTTHLEEIMCDADLDYLGRDDFFEIAHNLFLELKAHGKITSERQWDEIQIPFLNKHNYFTKTNITRRQPKKHEFVEAIKKRLEDNKYKD